MIKPTTYIRANTVADALRVLSQPDSVAVAGGGFLLRGMTLPYETVVDLQDVAELHRISEGGGVLTLGGAATLQMLIDSAIVPDAIKTAITRTLPVNVRNGVSLAEALSVPDAPRELLAVLAALDAKIIHSGFVRSDLHAGAHIHSVPEFLAGAVVAGYPYAGLIETVRVPLADVCTGQAHIARTPADLPIINAATAATLHDGQVAGVRVAVCGASALPVALFDLPQLIGQPFTAGAIRAAVEAATWDAQPVADYRGSVEYRRAMLPVVVQRALIASL